MLAWRSFPVKCLRRKWRQVRESKMKNTLKCYVRWLHSSIINSALTATKGALHMWTWRQDPLCVLHVAAYCKLTVWVLSMSRSLHRCCWNQIEVSHGLVGQYMPWLLFVGFVLVVYSGKVFDIMNQALKTWFILHEVTPFKSEVG